jgi:hypothetical protein
MKKMELTGWVRPEMSWWWRWLLLVVLTVLPLRILAQEPAPTLQLAFEPACASSGSTALGDALVLRMPDVRFAGGDGAWTLSWSEADGACVLELRRGEVSESMPLAADADASALEQAASRVAWWMSSSVPSPLPDEVVAEGSTEGSGEGSGEVSAEVPTPPLPVVPVVASVTPSMSWPVLSEPTRANFGFHVIGSAEHELDGFEFGLLWNRLSGWGRGMQFASLANIAETEFQGLQLAGGANISRGTLDGAQLGTVNFARRLRGAQMGQVNVGGEVVGAQLGQVNVVREIRGAQVGVVNVASEADFQLGLVNVATSADASIGLLSIVRDQPVYVNAGYQVSGQALVGIRHGSRAVQNLIEAEVDVLRPELMTAGAGIGFHFGRGAFFGELDLVTRAAFDTAQQDERLLFRGVQQQFRLHVGYRIAPRLAVVAGPSYTIYGVRKGRVDRPPDWATTLYDDVAAANVVLGWAGAYVGLRF